MFYLREDLPLVHGHAIYLDSEWALTSISQRQFWRDVRRSPGSAACCRSTSPSGSAPGAAPARWPRCARRRRSATRSGAQLQRPPRRRAGRRARSSLVPRRGDRVPEPVGRDERRAAAGQHEGLVGRPAGRGDARSRTWCWPPTTCGPTRISRRWRAPTRPPAARSTRSSTPTRLARAPLRRVAAARAAGARAGADARPRAVAAAPPGAVAGAGLAGGGGVSRRADRAHPGRASGKMSGGRESEGGWGCSVPRCWSRCPSCCSPRALLART